MELERWHRIEHLYHSALKVPAERRAVFLKDECKDDEEVRKEVESLLSYETSAAEFIESPAFDVAAKLMAREKRNEEITDPAATAVVSPRFHLLEKLGAGGMGIVYKVEDTKLRRLVALKFLPPELSRDPQALDRFQREAYAASALNHPNICTIHDIDECEGQRFIAMEFLEGQTLEQYIGAQPLPISKILDLAIQASDALGAAHARGIIHRDIKPSNIFVTARGQPKILDFGLAKLQESESADVRPTSDKEANVTQEFNPNLTLTRTGVAIGTAGYMSPEQIRGEKLDVRTDVFSFGLVLYEMATGQRAFKGDTGPALHKAILEHVPCPARQLNPQLPANLEKIINRAIAKDREARYQSATEMRMDLEGLERENEHRFVPRWWIAAAGLILVLLILGTTWWIVRQESWSSQKFPELKLRQLTFNSFENRVTSGAISPNGKYLAYADVNGMYIKDVGSGETRAVPQPGNLTKKSVQWEILSASWFPDSTRFLANAHPATEDPGLWSSEDTSVWAVPILGGAPRKLRDKATVYSVSPDSSLISFGANKGKIGEREIWVMGSTGEKARRLYEISEDKSIFGLFWEPDGRRVIYAKLDESGLSILSRDFQGGPAITLLSPAQTIQIDDVPAWLPDGRLLYSVRQTEPPDTCNYWSMRLDPGTGHLIEEPKQLTNWIGACMSSGSVTADGKRLAFLKWAGHMTSYVAELTAGGRRLHNLRQFPLSESLDLVGDWTADSAEIVYVSNRAGGFGLYKQPLDQETTEPLVTEGFGRNAHVTPDGKWILYLGLGDRAEPWETRPEPVMRVPVGGGPSHMLFMAKPWSLISCARSPSQTCALAEPSDDRKELIVSALDTLKGRGPELMRFALDPNDNNWLFDVSAAGDRIAVASSSAGPIYIFSARGQPMQQINVKGWSILPEMTWAADGKSLYVFAGIHGGRMLLNIDLQGNTYPIWRTPGASAETLAKPSPDGRHLAVSSAATNGNMWMMENF